MLSDTKTVRVKEFIIQDCWEDHLVQDTIFGYVNLDGKPRLICVPKRFCIPFDPVKESEEILASQDHGE